MAFETPKRGRLSRRKFIQGAAAASGMLLAGAARATTGKHDSKGHESWDDDRRGHDSECEGSRDLNLVNGRFLTLDKHNTVVSAIGVRDGRIVKIGHGRDLEPCGRTIDLRDRKSTRLNSSHTVISYAVFCL